MTWIKICGITNLEDAQTAVDAGADALGFVFYEKSPRNVAPETVQEIVRQLPTNVEKVGVIVGNQNPDLMSMIHDVGLTAAQVHMGMNGGTSGSKTYGLGCFPPGFKNYWSLPAAFFIENEIEARKFVASVNEMRAKFSSQPNGDRIIGFFSTFFIDSSTLQQPGGTGVVFDWHKTKEIVEYMKTESVQVVVAGGLTPDNVGEAIGVLNPWGVDVSSGVEASPGKKDPQKVRAFIKAVRSIENN